MINCPGSQLCTRRLVEQYITCKISNKYTSKLNELKSSRDQTQLKVQSWEQTHTGTQHRHTWRSQLHNYRHNKKKKLTKPQPECPLLSPPPQATSPSQASSTKTCNKLSKVKKWSQKMEGDQGQVNNDNTEFRFSNLVFAEAPNQATYNFYQRQLVNNKTLNTCFHNKSYQLANVVTENCSIMSLLFYSCDVLYHSGGLWTYNENITCWP